MSEQEQDSRTLAELQEEARSRDLPISGTKSELRQRLSDDDDERKSPPLVDDDGGDEQASDDQNTAQPVDNPVDEDREESASTRARGAVTDESGRSVGPDGPQPRDTGEEIAARTADSAEQSDDRYRKAFVVPPPAHAGVADYDAPEHDEMHNANMAALLETALHAGLHPKGRPDFDGSDTTPDGSVRLWYSVEAIPASEDEDPAGTQTPSAEIQDQGGSTADADRAPAGSDKAERREQA